MKKLISLTAIIAIVLVALTGCVSLDYEVKINEDGSGAISYIYGFDKSFLESMGVTSEEMVEGMIENAESSGYITMPYSDDDIEGFKATKTLDDITEFSLEESFGSEYVEDSEANKIKIEKNKSGTIYSQNASIDLTSMEDLSAYGFILKYTIALPVKAGDNNADQVSSDGKTLTWNLEAGEITDIKFVASSDGSSSQSSSKEDDDENEYINEAPKANKKSNEDENEFLGGIFDDLFGDYAMLVVGIGAGVLVLIVIVIIILIISRNKSKKAQVNNSPAPMEVTQSQSESIPEPEIVQEPEPEVKLEEPELEFDKEDEDKKE